MFLNVLHVAGMIFDMTSYSFRTKDELNDCRQPCRLDVLLRNFTYLQSKESDLINGPRQANLVLIAYASSESRETFRQKARSVAPLNGWACTVEICHDRMLEDTNLLDGAQMKF